MKKLLFVLVVLISGNLFAQKSSKDLINEYSVDADLTLIGFHEGMLTTENNIDTFDGYSIGNILFVNTLKGKFIK